MLREQAKQSRGDSYKKGSGFLPSSFHQQHRLLIVFHNLVGQDKTGENSEDRTHQLFADLLPHCLLVISGNRLLLL